MKIWLDDRRSPPDSTWTLVRTPQEAISLLTNNVVECISLDHDLGLIDPDGREQTGNDVLVWIEEQVIVNGMIPPEIRVHSSNPPGRDRLLRGVAAIERASEQA